MQLREPEFTLGVEEEYLLVDRATRDLVSDPPAELMRECARLCGEQVSPELMRSQTEIGTTICRDVAQAEAEIDEMIARIGRAGVHLEAARTLLEKGR